MDTFYQGCIRYVRFAYSQQVCVIERGLVEKLQQNSNAHQWHKQPVDLAQNSLVVFVANLERVSVLSAYVCKIRASSIASAIITSATHHRSKCRMLLPTFSDNPSEPIVADALLNRPVSTDCLVFLAFYALHDDVIGLFEIA